jgi:flavin-dependent dehydrogenase
VFERGRGGERFEIECERLVVADGVRSPLGKVLGREWHRDTVYGVAGRCYVASSTHADDPWISSHLELRNEKREVLSGYGWIFPLGCDAGGVNLGVGTLATAKRPADVAIKPLMSLYADQRRAEFGLGEELRMPTSALLPMGGAVSNVAGRNWALIGDAAACVNPLNGEGIDYGLETGRLVAELLSESPDADLATVWPALLRDHYGEAFSIARRLAGLVTVPRLLPALGPLGMRSDLLMTLALRWMGNLVTDEDRDRAARVWRWAGRRSLARDGRPLFA